MSLPVIGKFIATPPPRTTLGQKYCSCIFKVNSQNFRRSRTANPYAVCSSQIFHKRGLEGPGLVDCQYTRDYLLSLRYRVLLDFALEKGIVSQNENLSKDDLVDIIDEWLQEDNINLPPLPDINNIY